MKWIRVHYLDASALVKLLVKEKGTETLEKYRAAEYTSAFLTTSLCVAEALGVLKTKYLRKAIDEETYFTAADELLAYISGGNIRIANVDISDDTIFMDVEDIGRRHSLDISDAFLIVSVKKDYFSRFEETPPILITADENLAKAARAEGIKAWDILHEPVP